MFLEVASYHIDVISTFECVCVFPADLDLLIWWLIRRFVRAAQGKKEV